MNESTYEIDNIELEKDCKILHDAIVIKYSGTINIVPLCDVVFITRYDRNLLIYTTHTKFVSTATLSCIEKKMPSYFLRSHKGYIINTKQIEKITQFGQKTLTVKFYNCKDTALMTKEKAKDFKKILEYTGVVL